MIPDFPNEKAVFMHFWNEYLATKNRELLGIFGNMPSRFNHEGNKWILNRSDGTEDNQPYQQIEENITIEISEVPDLTPEKIREKFDKLANDMASQMSRKLFAEIARATKNVGNEFDAKGQPFTQDLFLKMLSMMDLEFDANGKWLTPTMIIPPELYEAKKDDFKSWETDEEFINKRNNIVDKKREEWRDRENNRKLVD